MARGNKQNKSAVEVVSLSAYTSPIIKEVRNEDFIFYGDDNNYFQYLIDRATNSTTNGGIISSMCTMIYGKGLDALDSSKKTEEYAQMKAIFSKSAMKGVIQDRKKLGMGAFQINYKGGTIKKALHFPMNTLRAEKCNDEGKIEAWYYHHDWANKKRTEKALRIPAFGYGNGKENEILVVKPYVSGYTYYPPVDYQGAIPYAVLEEEIGDYLINDTMNGFSGTKIVNFNNGVPDEATRKEITKDVTNKTTGAKGIKTIVAFNDGGENAATITDVPLNDAPAHYEYLSRECQEKLIVAHKVTSPMLLGLRTGNNSLGNNADEIKTASLLYDNTVIRTYQDEILEAVDEILAYNGITLKTYFKTVQPLEFTDTDNVISEEQREEETGVKMSSEEEGTDEEKAEMLSALLEDSISEEEIKESGLEKEGFFAKIKRFFGFGKKKSNS